MNMLFYLEVSQLSRWKVSDIPIDINGLQDIVCAHVHAQLLQSCPTLCDPWTVAYQAPLSMGFSRQEYWSGLACPPPGDLPDSGIRPTSLALKADSLPTVPPGKPYRTFHLLKAFVMCLRINGIKGGMKLCW